MTKVETLHFTFIDEETDDFADQVAPDESTARLWLGDQWIFSDRCPLLAPPASVGDWDALLRGAQAKADAARAAMMAARPGAKATMEQMIAYEAACAVYDRKAARLSRLNEMSVAAA
jgi:hypothetical protein